MLWIHVVVVYASHAPVVLLCILWTDTPLFLPDFILYSCMDINVGRTQIITVITEMPYISPQGNDYVFW